MSGQTQLTNEDLDNITALGDVLLAKALDEVSPNSDQVSTRDMAKIALACGYITRKLKHHLTELGI